MSATSIWHRYACLLAPVRGQHLPLPMDSCKACMAKLLVLDLEIWCFFGVVLNGVHHHRLLYTCVYCNGEWSILCRLVCISRCPSGASTSSSDPRPANGSSHSYEISRLPRGVGFTRALCLPAHPCHTSSHQASHAVKRCVKASDPATTAHIKFQAIKWL